MSLISRQSKRSAIGLIGSILALIGALFVIAGILIAGITQLSLLGTVSGQGMVLSCAYLDGSCEPTVNFQTFTGQQTTFHSSMSSSTFTPQSIVMVKYHPDHPQDAQVDPWIVSGLLTWIFAGGGLLLALVGLFLFLFVKNPHSANLVDQYFTAFEN